MSAVVDASFLLLAAVDPLTDPRASIVQAVLPELHERHPLIAPAQFLWEVGNVIHHKRPESFGGSLQERGAVLTTLTGVVELETPSVDAQLATGAWAERLGLSFYDAAYLELAMRDPRRLLVTEDAALRRKAAQRMGAGRALDAHGVAEAIEAGRL